MRVDLDAGAVGLIGDTLRDWERDFRRVLSVLLRTDSFLDRLVSTGPLSAHDARDFACVGPVARGSGIELDTRRDMPYDGYPPFAVARHADGDAMARMEVRFAEVDTSLSLIRNALDSLARGPIRNPVGAFVGDDGARRGRVGARRDALLACRPPARMRFASASSALPRSSTTGSSTACSTRRC